MTIYISPASNNRRCRTKLVVTKQIDHVVKITRPRSFPKCADFFSKHFFKGVAARLYAFTWRVGKNMSHWPGDGRQHEDFIRSEIQLDARQISAPRRDWATIANPRLAAFSAPLVIVDVEPALIGR